MPVVLGLLWLPVTAYQSRDSVRRPLSSTDYRQCVWVQRLNIARLRLEVVLVDQDARDADFFDVLRLLVPARFPLATALVVLEATEVHQPADRRRRVRRDLNEVETEIAGALQGVARQHNTELVALFIDHAHFAHADAIIGAKRSANP